MSKGPGRIERAVEAAFKANPDGYFSGDDLAKLAYQDVGYLKPKRSRRVSVLRAAHKVAKRLHWVSHDWAREVIFVNGLSLRSYGLGYARGGLGPGPHPDFDYKDGKLIPLGWLTEIERVSRRLATDQHHVKAMQPGGKYARAVEYHTAVANGDTEHAAKLSAEIEKAEQAEARAYAAALRTLG